MAVIVKYVVVTEGKPDQIFSTRQEAEAHDKMLDIAAQLTVFLQTAELNIADDTMESLSWFLAQHRESLGTICKGGTLKTPVAKSPAATVAAEPGEAAVAVVPKNSTAVPSTATTQPKAAA